MPALNYYCGTMRDLPTTVGRSEAVSTDVADTVEGLMPALMEIFAATGWAKQVIDQDSPARMFIDVGGVGVYDRLREMGYGEIVRPVNFVIRRIATT